MGQLPQTPSSHPYPLSLQLKLYQAFIFSVPILFTIILFLLFYLFYLKKRGPSPSLSSSMHMDPTSLNGVNTVLSLPFEMGLKDDLKEKLPIIIFDVDLRARDTQCCVCLGDFEIKEQLNQIPSCKHMFHLDCIHHWLKSNTTCPLCRASILPTKVEPTPPIRLNMSQLSSNEESDNGPQVALQVQDQLMVSMVDRTREEQSSSVEELTGQPCLAELGNSQPRDASIDSSIDYLNGNSIAVQIQIHDV